ncbi:hypothetical protein NA57DRAFT_70728 [Rhizodiscina lignyota]|uniref:T6SS Phospholipase effector Tle1-like catalytic domain-containing protein n=1 Tax=Rhizodiscina lignyota TaxID=1504668 RepID=A0A9P4IR37_9PEZI|nr:hypothetical protein NA57DRAFT_70728 [Rhizodiscina lignyota]
MAPALEHQSKKIIICCDGTWDNSDNGFEKGGMFSNGSLQSPSNVTHLTRATLPEDENHKAQVVYYQAGVGSTSISMLDHLYAGATGAGLSENIREAYGFLANNYMDGDSIFLVGFSRGAFTARSIGGMLGSIGLLTKDGMRNFYDCFSDYENAGVAGYKPKLPIVNKDFTLKADPAKLQSYLDSYRLELLNCGLAQEVEITAIGVWDTVGALGMPIHPWLQNLFGKTAFQEYQFYDTTLDNHIQYAFQALALDEHRSAFTPAVWERRDGCQTKLKQVWFAGSHSNIGGGSGSPDTSVADISLAWMMSNLSQWISFDRNYLSTQTALNRAYNQSQKITSPRWGCGPIYNSLTTLYKWLGSVMRTPDRYHRTDYKTGMPIEGEMLQHTNEMVHASVRARYKLGGKNADGKAAYQCKALGEWALQTSSASKFRSSEDGAVEEDGVKWTYVGKAADGQGKVMVEDELGKFELELLEMVDPSCKAELFGN